MKKIEIKTEGWQLEEGDYSTIIACLMFAIQNANKDSKIAAKKDKIQALFNQMKG